MTFEELLISSISTQLAPFTGCPIIQPYGNIPSTINSSEMFVRIRLGETKTRGLNTSLAQVATWIQFFYLDIGTSPDQTIQSDVRQIIESFFDGGYTPPAVSPGDPDRIDSIKIWTIDPPDYDRPNAISIRRYTCICNFTIL